MIVAVEGVLCEANPITPVRVYADIWSKKTGGFLIERREIGGMTNSLTAAKRSAEEALKLQARRDAYYDSSLGGIVVQVY